MRHHIEILLLLVAFHQYHVLCSSDSTICHDLCEGGSCCEYEIGKYDCCPFVNGICCANLKTCCPQGSRCNTDNTCEYPNNLIIGMKLLKIPKNNPAPSTTTVLSPVLCPDRSSACPIDSTCCSMDSESWGCCGFPNAVCCDDSLHCCPKGTKCNSQKASCDPVSNDPLSLFKSLFHDTHFWPELNEVRVTNSQGSIRKLKHDPLTSSGMAYTGVACNGSYDCPSQTTCCLDASKQYACCPLPDAVCCSDNMHCCPKNSHCNIVEKRCVVNRSYQPQVLFPTNHVASHLSTRGHHQLCPDGHSDCLSDQTCCKLPNDTWGCCPLPDAVCCSDGQHCCPMGFKCNLASKSCVKASDTSPIKVDSSQVICPNKEVFCDHGTTCCPLPNNEYGCCPFENAVCCSDMGHCCPEGTVCDPKNKRCNKIRVFPELSPLVSSLFTSGSNVCPSGLVSCPEGTCCKNTFGIDACCSHPNAVCCQHGSCCPQGTRCDDHNRRCIPTDSSSSLSSVPWFEKIDAQRSSSDSNKKLPVINSMDHLCPDGTSVCEKDKPCCRLIDDSFGCCPLSNGTCCEDRRHCCPADTLCGENGQCIRQLRTTYRSTIVKANIMTPVVRPAVNTPYSPATNTRPGEVIHPNWCGSCSDDEFCCPNADGLPNRKCCPHSRGMCCADGEHCCPQGTRCRDKGFCETDRNNVEKSFAPYLVASKPSGPPSVNFLQQIRPTSFELPLAKSAFEALLNPLFLTGDYYQANAHRFTVCPDRERICSLEQRCCLSSKQGFVCVPNTAVCCSVDSDTYCPIGSECSSDGLTCLKRD